MILGHNRDPDQYTDLAGFRTIRKYPDH